MQVAIVSLKTLTYAQKTKRLLKDKGISAKLIKLSGTDSGCTYGVEFDKAYFYDVLALLRQNGISYGKII